MTFKDLEPYTKSSKPFPINLESCIQTLTPKPFNLEPETLSHQPLTLTPKPSIMHTKPNCVPVRVRTSIPSTLNPKTRHNKQQAL